MVKLEQIKKDGDHITCSVFFEDCNEPVRLVYSISDDIVQYEPLPEGYEYCVIHINHVRHALRSMAEDGRIEPKKTIMGY